MTREIEGKIAHYEWMLESLTPSSKHRRWIEDQIKSLKNEMNLEMENALAEMFTKLDAIKPFTVGDMKKALEGLPDETQILIGGTDSCSFDWANLSLDFDQPNEEEGFLALTFYIKNDYDPRQF
jgi:hypothetical protein